MEQDFDPRTAKLLTDLLALCLSDNDSQAEAALGAIRRRAARDGLTGGALKQWLERLEASPAPVTSGADPASLRHLHETVELQRQQLAAARQAQAQAEHALFRARQPARPVAPAPTVAMNGESLYRSRRNSWMIGFVLGLGLGVAALGAAWLTRHRMGGGDGGFAGGMGAGTGAGAGAAEMGGIDIPARRHLSQFLHQCYLASSNSLAGTPMPLHVLVDYGADGRVTGARLGPMPRARMADPQDSDYARLVVRTIGGGGCGKLPLPESLQGKPGELNLFLPR